MAVLGRYSLLLVVAMIRMASLTEGALVNFKPWFRNLPPGTSVDIREDLRPGAVVFTATASDANGDPLTFTVVNPNVPFEFDMKNAKTSLKNAPIVEYQVNLVVSSKPPILDYETTKVYSLTLQVSDKKSTAQATLQVKVLNTNDNSPTLTVDPLSLNVDEESSIGTSLGFNIAFSDADVNDVVYVGLTGEDAKILNINSNTGKVSLNSVIDVDPFKENRVFKPVVFASDGTLTSSTTITLTVWDVNDNPPVCSPDVIAGQITEETSGKTTVGLINCTDRDSSYNNNNKFSYTVVQGNSSVFGVESTGEIFVSSPLDYERSKSETAVIRVADGGLPVRYSTTVTVTITIKPTNDHAPIWAEWTPPTPADFRYSVFENITVGTAILTVSATDADLDFGQDITYSMSVKASGGSSAADVFRLDPTTGAIRLQSALDLDGPQGVSEYTVTVQASDGAVGTHTINRTVVFQIKDVNDNPPVFTGLPYPVVVIQEENAKAGVTVTQVSATDADSVSTNLTFRVNAVITGNIPLSVWKFSNVIPGQLELASDLDLDSDAALSPLSVLRLTVADNGTPEQSGTSTLTVSIVADNEFSPVIMSQPIGSVEVPEDTGPNTRVTQIEATDKDKGQEGQLVYSLIGGNTGQTFNIDSNGWISTQKMLDGEQQAQYVLTVLISDSGTVITRSVTTTVTIMVTDVNDNVPVCQSQLISSAIAENSPVNTPVANISCTDADTRDFLTLTVKTPLNSIFGITALKNATIFQLQLIQEVDYDSPTQSYQVEVEVSDGRNRVSVRVVVSLIAVNEFPPVFLSNPTVNVQENVIQNPVLMYTATDLDYSPHDIVSYRITSASNDGSKLLRIDPKSASIVLVAALDYEALPPLDKTYRLVIVAADGGGLEGTGTVTIVVGNSNDNAPVCAQFLYTVSVSEKQYGPFPHPVLSSLNCSDSEDGSNLTYSLNQTPFNHFTSSRGGGILLTGDLLDFETAPSYTLTVKVTDQGQPAQTATVTVYINIENVDEGGPVFLPTLPVTISEAAMIGQFVADVLATDPDDNGESFGNIQYSIIGGDIFNQFVIDPYNGRVSVRKQLDFETLKSYNLVIQARDRDGTVSSTTQIVNLMDVNDERPVCAVSSFLVTVAESEPAGHLVTDLGCTDADLGTTLTYTIVSGDNSLFQMDDSRLKLRRPLNFEEPPPSHQLSILVSDSIPSHNMNISGTVITGSVDEGPPQFSAGSYTVRVPENQTLNSIIFTVTAMDPDSPRDPNGQVRYSFSASSPPFSIDSSNGQILLAGPLDREETATYFLLVRAADALGVATATVTVIVEDINDNAPRFKQPVFSGVISQTDPVGTSIVTVLATDADDPATNNHGTVRYMLAGSPLFRINAMTGVITNAAVINFETGPRSYSFTITATDSNGAAEALSSTCLVNVYVTTANRHAPRFTPDNYYSVRIFENEYKTGDVILEVTALDEDTGPDGELTLTLAGAEDRFYLTQNGNFGEVRLLQDIDFDLGDTVFTFEIIAADQGNPARYGSCTVAVFVDDVNDNPPLCPRSVFLAKVEGDTNLTRIVCSDVDQSTRLSYRIISTKPSSIQPVVTKDGMLTTTVPLDYESSSVYEILLQVRDNGSVPLVANITIKLNVIDINDNDPSFDGSLIFDLREDASPGSGLLYTVKGRGNDGPTDTVTYTLLDDSIFFISSDTGEIRLKTKAPDYERVGGTYTTLVCIQDTANPVERTACQNITVNILDTNDEMPQFSPSVYQATVAEDAVPGKSVVTVTAVDRDASQIYNSITYTIRDGNGDGLFRILSSGLIETAKKLDYEVSQSYVLSVRASDGLYNATALCNIEILPVNEFTPQFNVSTATVHIKENVPLKTFVFTASASDQDLGPDGVIRYNIESGPFSIDAVSGNVTVAGSLDREVVQSYNLIVLASDQGVVSRTGTLLVTVIVDDVNDHAPTCDASTYFVTVRENVTPGPILVTLNCVDDDFDPDGLNNAISYTIDPVFASIFSIDQQGSLSLVVGAELDREIQSMYLVDVTVSDQGPRLQLNTTAKINVTVLDVNDNSPYFLLIASPSVPENTLPGTVLAEIKVNDNDEGVNSQIGYQISSGNANGHFSINASGHLTLLRPLDYESSQSEILLITARDQGSPARSATATLTVSVLDINDNPPACFPTSYTKTLLENSTSELVAALSCKDPDRIGQLSFNITNGNDGNFLINSTSGVLTVKPNASLDYEKSKSYSLEVTASDGLFSDTVMVNVQVVDVNELGPKFSPPGPYRTSVSESRQLNSVVFQFKAVDPDTSDGLLRFSLVRGNTADRFYLEPFSGSLQLKQSLDYENQTEYDLTVTVQDTGGLSDTAQLYISVTDVNDNSPTCSDKMVNLTLAEAVVHSSVYLPACTDADKEASPIIEYRLLPGASRAFSIDRQTGQLSVVEPLDYELDWNIFLTILAEEAVAESPRAATIDVHVTVEPVNEFDPVFEPSNNYGPLIVPENTMPGTIVAYPRATDQDKGLNDGIIRYAISGGNPSDYFKIDETNGEIQTLKRLNRRDQSEFKLLVTAMDGVPGSSRSRSATATVTLQVTDVNDNAPQLVPPIYSLNISETAAFGPSVVLAYLNVQDPDDDSSNGEVTVRIISGNTGNTFSISGSYLILARQLDYENTTFYQLQLELTDSGTPPLTSTGQVRVNVLPVNEAAPVMKETSAAVSIPENAPLGTLVYDANATDTDSEVHGQISYSIDGSSAIPFVVNPNTGQLLVNAPLDFEVLPNVFTVIIRAKDGAGASDPNTSIVSVVVTLLDVNDNAPKCPSSETQMSVPENAAVGTLVGFFSALDADSQLNAALTYTQTGGFADTYLRVEPGTGAITTTAAIDYELAQVFYLSVLASDGGQPPLSSNCLVKVNVTNLNDNYPVISPAIFVVLVPMTASVGDVVMTFSASDADTSLGAFSAVTDNKYFQVDSVSGAVRVRSELDKDSLQTHVLYIRVEDLPTPADLTVYTSTATLTVYVQDSNNYFPVISGDYNISLPENTLPSTVILKINASDPDPGQSGNLSFNITSGNTGGAFSIDSEGFVQVVKPLDREDMSIYLLTIQVRDQSISPKSSEVQAIIRLDDINDNNPVFSQQNYTFLVPENAPLGASIGRVLASDLDLGSNSQLTYGVESFFAGDRSHFALNPSSGVISVATSKLDDSRMPSYTALVRVTDAGLPPRSSLATVNIVLIDYVNVAPRFTQDLFSASLREDSPPGTPVLQLVAIDADDTDIKYYINQTLLDSEDTRPYFQVEASTGMLSTIAPLDFEDVQQFQLLAYVVDRAGQTATTTALVNVVDVNDNSPVFSPSFYNSEVAYTAECNDLISTVRASDADSGDNSRLSYYLIDDTNSDLFDLSADSGQVRLQGLAQASASYKMQVQARDAGQPPRTAVKPARLRVDTFMPGSVVVTLRLGISRNAFLAQLENFKNALEKVISVKYPNSVIRVWCILEYEGLAEPSPTSSRQLLADQPVDVNIYALKDNSTESEENYNQEKEFIPQSEMIAFFGEQEEGAPSSILQDGEWNYLNISGVTPYLEKQSTSAPEQQDKIIMIIAIILALILLTAVILLIISYCCDWFGISAYKKQKFDVLKFDDDVGSISKAGLKDKDGLTIDGYFPRYAVIRFPDKKEDSVPDLVKDHSEETVKDQAVLQTSAEEQPTPDANTDSTVRGPRAMVIALTKGALFDKHRVINGSKNKLSSADTSKKKQADKNTTSF